MVQGLYINLDRKPERRRHMEAEFSRFKLSKFYQRVSAVDGHPGETGPKAAAIGCFRSHLKAMEIAKGLGEVVHILEDDRVLSGRLRPFLESRECARALSQFDLVFLEMWVDHNLVQHYQHALAQAKGGLYLMDLRGARIGSTASYVVSRKGAERISHMLAGGVHDGPRMPVDNFYSNLMNRGYIKAAVVLPFLSCTDIETGTRSSIQPASREALIETAILRSTFFVDRDRYAITALPLLEAAPAKASP